ncbi:MAG: exosome complex RNA-binding protein Rrp4 [Nitrososphaerales archaeon]
MVVIKRKYVIPGDLITDKNYKPLSNVIKIDDKIYSTRIGLAEITKEGVKVIPLSGPYIPKVNDLVIGKIVNYSAFAWEVDINSCFSAYLPAQNVFGKEFSTSKDALSKKLTIGDLILARIVSFDRTKDPILSLVEQGLGKIFNGEIVRITPMKIPRLIGKKGSMMKTIEKGTGTKLIIGQNGVIVIKGEPQSILRAIEAIKMIEEGAHMQDLTQKIRDFLGIREKEDEDGETDQ